MKNAAQKTESCYQKAKKLISKCQKLPITGTVQVRKLVDRELQEPLFDVFLWGVLFKYKTKF